MNVAPSEAWCMEPRHFWWLLEDLLAEQRAAKDQTERLTDAEKDELLEIMRAEGWEADGER